MCIDDKIIIGDDEDAICMLNEILSIEFDLKDLGKLKYFLGIKMAITNMGLVIN